MPELPEVRTIAAHLNKSCKGKTIKSIEIRLPKLIKEVMPNVFYDELVGRTITKVTNVGKFIVFHFENESILLSHLRMEGKYHTEARSSPSSANDHIVFIFTDGTKLYYNDTRQFGTFHLRNQSDYLAKNPLVKLGPEPSAKSVADFYKELQKRKTPIKTVLLDQCVLSGLGNIYVDEVLWTSSLHPLTPANKLTKQNAEQILVSASQILELATKMGGTTVHTFESFNGVLGGYQDELKVHMQLKKPCPHCGAAIIKIKVGGRGTYFCPRKQVLI